MENLNINPNFPIQSLQDNTEKQGEKTQPLITGVYVYVTYE